MTDEAPLHPSTLRQQRERVIEALTVHFADDHIDADDFERRVDLAYRAHSLEELDAVRTGLPALRTDRTGGTEGTALAEAPVRALASPGDVRDRQLVVAILGGTERKGAWTPARQVNVLAVMGGVELDFREARFGPGVTELTVFAMMGGVEILVPPGLRVQSDGFGLLGGFEGLDQDPPSNDPDQPTLRIRGIAIMGGVDITERRPGETAGDRKRRLRAERRARARLKPGP
jgi:hypothetical protein